jgi:hypothetical protein
VHYPAANQIKTPGDIFIHKTARLFHKFIRKLMINCAPPQYSHYFECQIAIKPIARSLCAQRLDSNYKPCGNADSGPRFHKSAIFFISLLFSGTRLANLQQPGESVLFFKVVG